MNPDVFFPFVLSVLGAAVVALLLSLIVVCGC